MSDLPAVVTVELTRLQLQPGDTLVVAVTPTTGPMPEEDLRTWHAAFARQNLPTVQVIVYDASSGALDLSRIRPPRLFELAEEP